MPLIRNAVTFNACQGASPSRRTTAIFVSNMVRVQRGAAAPSIAGADIATMRGRASALRELLELRDHALDGCGHDLGACFHARLRRIGADASVGEAPAIVLGIVDRSRRRDAGR